MSLTYHNIGYSCRIAKSKRKEWCWSLLFVQACYAQLWDLNENTMQCMTWKFPTEVNKAGRLRAVPLQSVESKLGRTGESELAERETGERRLLPSFPSAFARFARFPRSRNHPEGLLAVYKAGSAFWAINSWRISYSSKEKGTEAKKRPAIVSWDPY